ncbi:MAG: DUF2892 domain-containing protein [Opitutae bacterium]|nr:DUF2892 domain-containing protein [Opitutae bacterium]
MINPTHPTPAAPPGSGPACEVAFDLNRQVRLVAGTLVLVGLALGWLVHPGFYGLAAFVGAGLVFAGLTNFCGLCTLLARLPWNRRLPPPAQSAPKNLP